MGTLAGSGPRRALLRWLAPVAVAALIIGGGAVVSTVTAAASPLPARSAAQLVADVQGAHITGLSGTVVISADLGIPDLPSVGSGPMLGGRGSSDLTSLLSGTHTLRVWSAGPEQVRVALLGSLGETDVIRNGADLWTWSSTTDTATHRSLPAGSEADHHGTAVTEPLGGGLPVTPQQAAAKALSALSSSTAVSTESGVTVAGRAAYQLVLQPKDTRSLVSSVRIAIDAVQHVPLRVQVYATAQAAPAFQVGFTSVDFDRPAAGTFDFTPPPGATVTQAGAAPEHGESPGAEGDVAGSEPGVPGTAGMAEPTPAQGAKVVGSGWTAVLVTGAGSGLPGLLPGSLPAAGQSSSHGGPGAGQLDRILAALPQVSGAWGSGRLLQTAVLSAVVTADGRLAVGAVPPDLLYAALADR